MNKFNFVASDGKKSKFDRRDSKINVFNPLFKDFCKNFVFRFTAKEQQLESLRDGVEGVSRRAPGMIVIKSDIKENVVRQLKSMKTEVAGQGEELLYLRMNGTTKNMFRMYFSYEVDYQVKNLSDIDKEAGKVTGSVMGIKIIQDESLKDSVVWPVVRAKVTSNKYDNIFQLN